MAFSSWKKHKPKGQQPVNVKELEKHKKWHYDYIMKDRNPNAYIRNRFSNEYRDKIKNVDDIWKYLTINASRNLDHYHQYLTQAERNLINMIPCGRRYEIMGRHFSLVGYNTNNEDIDEENIAIDTVLNELDNRISVKKVEQLINKIKNETWYIEGGTEAKQACIEELESLLNKE